MTHEQAVAEELKALFDCEEARWLARADDASWTEHVIPALASAVLRLEADAFHDGMRYQASGEPAHGLDETQQRRLAALREP